MMRTKVILVMPHEPQRAQPQLIAARRPAIPLNFAAFEFEPYLLYGLGERKDHDEYHNK